jgi:hypothetical protein
LVQQLLEDLAPYCTEWERGFLNSIIAWIDRQRLSIRQIETLHRVGRNAAGRSLAAERRKHLAIAMPANMLAA